MYVSTSDYLVVAAIEPAVGRLSGEDGEGDGAAAREAGGDKVEV